MKKFLLTSFYTLFFLSHILAQPSLNWEAPYHVPTANDQGNVIVVDYNGNVYVPVKNEMMQYNNGILKSYYQSQQLLITELSFEKELSLSDVDGINEDERNSNYNIKSAKERRV